MCGVANTVGRVVSGVTTLGASELARSTLGKNNLISKGLQVPGLIATGGASAGGVFGNHEASPTLLPQGDPKLMLAQTGGAPLLAQISLGVPVEDALAGYFGKNSGEDFATYYKSLSPQDQSAIDSVRTQLTQIQGNTELRNKAVQKVIDDFPNVAATALQKQKAGYATSEKAYDDATSQVLEKASSQLAAKFAASGGFNSGSFNKALADESYMLAGPRADLAARHGDALAETEANNEFAGASLRLGEVDALRSFQNRMLGTLQDQGFHASQAFLDRTQRTSEFNADATMRTNESNNASDNAMFGSLGSLAGTLGGAALAGPIGAKIGGTVGSTAGGSLAPRLSLYNNSSSGYSRYQP
jgi:hypothetical protein